jgi:sugar lactone lactonase YvrE
MRVTVMLSVLAKHLADARAALRHRLDPSLGTAQDDIFSATIVWALVATLLLVLPAAAEQRAVLASSDQAVSAPRAKAGPAAGKRSPKLQPLAQLFGPQPAGIAVSPDRHIFITFPKWGDSVDFTVGELKSDGQLVPFPSSEAKQLQSVQGICIDAKNRVWLLDAGASRLVAYNIDGNKRAKSIDISAGLRGGSYPNDLCVTTEIGADGTAFISDSGLGAVIVVDIDKEECHRRLERHPSTLADASIKPKVEDQPLKSVGNCDGIAISPDAKLLYYTPFTSHSVYSADAMMLADRNRSDDDIAETVKKVCDKPSMNDGIACDGSIYTTDEEDNAIRRISPEGQPEILVQDERLLWPDSVCVSGGYVYTVTNQLNRAKDKREQPYMVFRVPLR